MNNFYKEQAIDIIDQMLEAIDLLDEEVLEIEGMKNILPQRAVECVDGLSRSMLKFYGAKEDLLVLKQLFEDNL